MFDPDFKYGVHHIYIICSGYLQHRFEPVLHLHSVLENVKDRWIHIKNVQSSVYCNHCSKGKQDTAIDHNREMNY